MEFSLQAPVMPLNGAEIIEDLCSCISETLGKNCDLRASDAFESYSAKVIVALYLRDLGVQTIETDIAIGQPDSEAPPSVEVGVEIPDASPDVVRERLGIAETSMEIAVDGSALSASPAKRRFYAPRRRG